MCKFIVLCVLFSIFSVHCQTEFALPLPKVAQNVNLGSNTLSDLYFAIYLTTLAKDAGAKPTFIGQTWIFGWWNKYPSEIAHLRNDLFSEAVNRVETEFLDSFYPMLIIPCFGDESTKTNFSYDREFDVKDLRNPTRIGVQKMSSNYFSIFISNYENGHNLEIPEAVTTALIVRKFARPHLDYFFYIGTSDLLGPLFETFQLQEMRYRFSIVPGNPVIFKNPCQSKSEKTAGRIFTRRCDRIIADRHYHITACKVESMVRYENYPNGTLKWGAGTVVAMFLEASRRHNFTFDIRYAHYDGASGFKVDGVWKGAVGEVLSRESDIAFAVGVTESRLPIIDPSVAQTRISRVFYIRTPPCRTTWKAIFWPLAKEVWLFTWISALFVLPISYLSVAGPLKWEQLRNGGRSPIYRHRHIWLEVAEVLFRILLDQSVKLKKWRGMRIRLLFFLWAICSIVLGTGYRSKLFSFLSFLEPDQIPTTHKELSLSDYKIYFRYMGGIAYLYYKNSKDPVHQRTLKKAILVNSSQECVLRALMEENAACLEYQVNGDFAIQGNMTLNPFMKASEVFVTSKDKELSNIINWSFRKGSPWRESFDKVILFSLAAGLYEVWEKEQAHVSRVQSSHWLNDPLQGSTARVKERIEAVIAELTTGPKAMNIMSLKAVFVILGVGLLISAMVAIGEKLRYYLKMIKLSKKIGAHLNRRPKPPIWGNIGGREIVRVITVVGRQD